MNFDRINDPTPMPATLAVLRGQVQINWPGRLILLAGIFFAWALSSVSGVLAVVVGAGGFFGAWFWWSYFVPKWRTWALQRGADPDELQAKAVKGMLVWPKGSIFERTEFRSGR